MDTTTLSMLGRVVERLVVVVAGIVLIVLGYHLYLHGVGGEANIKVETIGQKYQLENATPGIIFVLLGAIVLGRSILSPLKIEAINGRIIYSEHDVVLSGLQLHSEDISELYRAVFEVVSDSSIDSNVRNALADAYRKIYEKNKLGPDGAARLQKLREMKEGSLTRDQLNELTALGQKIPSECSPERFRVAQ